MNKTLLAPSNTRADKLLVEMQTATTAVKQLITSYVSNGKSDEELTKALNKAIAENCDNISNEVLREQFRKSLIASARKMHYEIKQTYAILDNNLKVQAQKQPLDIDILDLLRKTPYVRMQEFRKVLDDGRSPAVPIIRDYIKSVRNLTKALSVESPKIVTTRGGRAYSMPARLRAELAVRYSAAVENLQSLIDSGVKFAWISSHPNCSPRCSKWQGRLYSLFTGTIEINGKKYKDKGVINGIPYEPITNALRGENGDGNGCISGYNCFDKETEVYTKNGWVKFSELQGDEIFYTLDKDTKKTEWQKAVNYFKKLHCGDMVYLHSTTTDLCVTPDHDLLIFTQRNRQLRYKKAIDFSTATYQYAGEQWDGESPEFIKCGGKKIKPELYCKLLAYYLADGSVHCETAIKIAQQNNDTMYNELKELPFSVWHDKDKIVIHGKELKQEFEQFGKCDKKYIPQVIKNLSKKDINVFIDAYLHTDGYITKPSQINGYTRKGHKAIFTVSKRIADDFTELALKAGYRPKIDILKTKGRKIQFKNGIYALNYDNYIVNLNSRTNITQAKKNIIQYCDYVYCVEVPNHTLLVKRNGRVQWCGNCRHRAIAYEVGSVPPQDFTAAEIKKEYGIDKKQRTYENDIRRLKTEEMELRASGLTKEASAVRKKWRVLTVDYQAYSVRNNRAFYPYRCMIDKVEIKDE